MTLLIFRAKSSSSNEIVIPSGAQRSGEPALSEVEGDLLFLFCPSDLTASNKSHHPPLVIPTRIPATQYYRAAVRLSVKKGA